MMIFTMFQIKIPVLLLNAKDDPIVPDEVLAIAKAHVGKKELLQ